MKPNDTNQATPRPWSVVTNWNWQTVRSPAGAIIFSTESSDCSDAKNAANCELVVQAVNLFALHEAVAEAAEKVKAMFDSLPLALKLRIAPPNYIDDLHSLNAALSALEAKKGQ